MTKKKRKILLASLKTALGSNVSLRGLSGSVTSNALKLSTANDGIGYQCKNENADFSLGYDDIKVDIGTNSDGNVGDYYNWIDMFYQNQKEKIKINKGKEKDYV